MDIELLHLICWLFAYLAACGLIGFGLGQRRGSPMLGIYYGLWFGLASEVLVPMALLAVGYPAIG
jgi:hypothetical protein